MVTSFQTYLHKLAQTPRISAPGTVPEDWGVPVPISLLLASTGAGALMSDHTDDGYLDFIRGGTKGLATGAGALLGARLAEQHENLSGAPSLLAYLGIPALTGAGGYALSDQLFKLLNPAKEEPEPKQAGVNYFSGVMKNVDTVPVTPKPGPRGGVRIIDQLRQAKVESDRRNWQEKHRILRGLMVKRPNEFWVDSDEGEIVGITHRSGFRFHLPRRVVPDTVVIKTPGGASSVVTKIAEYVDKTIEKVSALRQSSQRPAVFYDPDADVVHDADEPPPELGKRPWVIIKQAAWTVKDIWDPILKIWHVKPTEFTSLYGGGTPLAATIAGGLLGAGGGYLGGKLIRRFLPDKYFDEESVPRSMAILGGLLGATPGAIRGFTRQAQPDVGWSGWVRQDPLFAKESAFIKKAQLAGAFFNSEIPVDTFNRVVWQDPLSSTALRSGVSGLVEGASQLRGGSAFVSPSDIAHIAVGAGTGLLSGALVGRVLGALAGLKPEAQDFLQQTGMWSGVVRGAMPRFLGGSR